MRRAFAILTVLLAHAAPANAWWSWIEAEHAAETNLTTAHAFAPNSDAERAALSGGAWIGADGQRNGPLFATYDVPVPSAGRYALYARKFWKHGPFRARFDDTGEWATVDANVPLLDATPIRTNVVANWTRVGTFDLATGAHRLRIESTTNDGAIAFDCFLLTDEPFSPRGRLKPGEHFTSVRPGWFAWDPSADAADSPIDLSWLNPPIDGENARILARDGRLVRAGTGEPVRFWGVNVGGDLIREDDDALDRHAAFLARRGVNWARIHSAVFRREGNVGAVDGDQVRNVQRAVAAFKRHGIYCTLSTYYPLWIRLDERAGWAGYHDANPFGLLYFDGRFDALYRSWWHALLTTPDPQTGVALADEPAVLSLELVNEDSLFFWTFKPYETVPAPQMEPLERRFAAWLATRYGSIKAAVARWPGRGVRGDDVGDGRVGIEPLWQLIDARDVRAIDTTRFLYEIESGWYARTRDWLRSPAIGARALITTSNWTTASDRYLTPIERAIAAAVGAVGDRHGYFGGRHEGPKVASQLSPGDTYNDRSALRFDPENPGDPPSVGTPLLDVTYGDRPTMLSEVDWPEPNRFRAEMPWIAAACGARQDLDAIGFFAVSGAPGWEPSVGKFSIASPVALGQSPAAALAYRQGLIDESPVTIERATSLDDLLALKGEAPIDARAVLAGRAHETIGASPTSRPSTSPTTRASDGEVTWNADRGLLRIDAPRAQIACGFLAASGPVTLGDVTIESSLPYGAIAVVPLDGQPIAHSRRLLVQSMSEQQNAGWQTVGDEAGTKTILSIGTAPTLVRELTGTVTLRDTSARWTAQACEANGSVVSRPTVLGGRLVLPATCPYVVLSKTDEPTTAPDR